VLINKRFLEHSPEISPVYVAQVLVDTLSWCFDKIAQEKIAQVSPAEFPLIA
jgi:hypothetical protein